MKLSRITTVFFATTFLLSLASILFQPSDLVPALYLAGFSLLVAVLAFSPKRGHNAY